MCKAGGVIRAQLLFSLNLLAAMVWTGGMVAVALTTVAARQTLEADQQVRFFRALGRRYGVVSGLALALFAVTGFALAGDPSGWSGTEIAVAVLTAAVAGLTVAGVLNAREVQRLRAELLERADDRADDHRLQRARRTANVLRGLIAAVTLAAVIVATA